jgi:hypothetical protein
MNENRAQGLLSRIGKQETDRRNSRRYFFVSRTAGQLHFVRHRVTRRLSSLNEGVKGDRPWLTPKKIHLKAVNDSQMQGQHQDIRRARNIESLGN